MLIHILFFQQIHTNLLLVILQHKVSREAWVQFQPLHHCTENLCIHLTIFCGTEPVSGLAHVLLYSCALCIFPFLKFASGNLALIGLTLNINIWLSLFWSTWSSDHGQPSQHCTRPAQTLPSQCKACIGSAKSEQGQSYWASQANSEQGRPEQDLPFENKAQAVQASQHLASGEVVYNHCLCLHVYAAEPIP